MKVLFKDLPERWDWALGSTVRWFDVTDEFSLLQDGVSVLGADRKSFRRFLTSSVANRFTVYASPKLA